MQAGPLTLRLAASIRSNSSLVVRFAAPASGLEAETCLTWWHGSVRRGGSQDDARTSQHPWKFPQLGDGAGDGGHVGLQGGARQVRNVLAAAGAPRSPPNVLPGACAQELPDPSSEVSECV